MPYKDPQKRKEYHRQYVRAYRRKPSVAPQIRLKDKAYQHKATCYRYGITPEIYQATFLAQGSCCASCKSTEPYGKGTWHIDHDHKTNRFRGILCYRCNVGIGIFQENKDTMLKAIEYLNRTT
jgi:hypothetical protein